MTNQCAVIYVLGVFITGETSWSSPAVSRRLRFPAVSRSLTDSCQGVTVCPVLTVTLEPTVWAGAEVTGGGVPVIHP